MATKKNKEIKTLLKESAVSDSYDFDKGKLKLMGIKIDDRSDLRDKSLAETTYLNPNTSFTPVSIVRDIEDKIENETIIPRSHNVLKEGDIAYFIAKADEGVDTVLSLSGRKNLQIKNIMIFGGSDLAFISAKHLSKKYNVKFDLLSDEKKSAIKAYKTWGKKKFMGKEFMGTIRSTFVIEKNKIIKAVSYTHLTLPTKRIV